MRPVKMALLIVIATTIVLLAIASMAWAWLYHDTHRGGMIGAEYVALGSSFASAPGVGARATDSPLICLRSATNYPHLLARKLGLQLRDMSCGGATSKHVIDGGQFTQGPQIDAIGQSTKLVTVTVGGNDLFYLGNLLAWSCQGRPSSMPWMWRQMICRDRTAESVVHASAALPASMQKIADEVRQRAPRARLVFVDYVSVLPDVGHCPDRLPITDSQLARGRAVAAALRNITAESARRNGALLVQASELSRGHDICSQEPWVFGFTLPANPLNFEPIAYHPNQVAMQVVSDAIASALQ